MPIYSPETFTYPEDLSRFAEKCRKSLLDSQPYEFNYPEECPLQSCWPVEKIKESNKKFLSNLKGKGNVYAIFLKTHGRKWNPVYVGQRKSKGLRDRLTQHLIKKNAQTGSKLKEVKEWVTGGGKIGIAYIKVEPGILRLVVEEHIISSCNNNLSWNIHG